MVYEKITQGDTTVAEMYITYGETGPLYIDYNGTIYYYILNGQGDVVGLARWDEAVDVTYSYNAWGEIESISGNLASTLGVHNPLRYRGYVYDTETEQYYLNSRYYNPEWGRFINADVYISTGQGMLGYNMFAYCNNNPVNACDPSGEDAIWIQDVDLVPVFGHTGLLLEKKDGTWYEFFWGRGEGLLNGKKNPNSWIREVYSFRGMTAKEVVKSVYFKQKMSYEKYTIIAGDFSECITFADTLKNSRKYGLLKFNCMQASIEVLLQGNFAKCRGDYIVMLKRIQKSSVPNIAWTRIDKFNNYVNFYWSFAWYQRRKLVPPSLMLYQY